MSNISVTKNIISDVLVAPPVKTRKAKQISMLDHAKKKSMWSGSKNTQTIDTYVLRTNEEKEQIFQLVELKYPPALLKIIDEVIVNAIDHHTHFPKLVNQISIEIIEGNISIYNNGPGIPVELTKNLNDVEMYIPQLITSEFLAGDNLDDAGDNIKGGTNGIGLKLAAAFSTKLTLETADAVTKLHYTQEFLHGLTKIEPPIIKSMNKTMKPFTKITFHPDYAEFKLDPIKFQPILFEILQTRAWQAAAYTKAVVSFNNKVIPVKAFDDFCQMFSDNLMFSTTMKSSSSSHIWDVCFAISDGKERHMSIVNGVFMPKGGTHINYIQNQLVSNLRERVEKEIKKAGIKFNKNYITNNTFIFMRGAIPSPEFMSQTKEAISDPIEKFQSYSILESDWKKIWELLEPAILSSFLKKQLGDLKTRANRGKVDVPKYTEAKYCRDSKKCQDCGLIITEGDSAIGTAHTGLLSKASNNFNYDWFGVFSIGGVPINGLKESVDIKPNKKNTLDDDALPKSAKTKTGDAVSSKPSKPSKPSKTKLVKASDDMVLPDRKLPNQKLINNERISSLIKVLGLDFNKTYALNEIGNKEWKTIRYGFIVGLTDQDLDGFNIYGLIVTFLITYWPALLHRGFLRRINTPVIRAYPKNKKDLVKEFYSEREVATWTAEIGDDTKKYTLKYYKGLGSHKQAFKEVTQMFKKIETKIKTYIFDEQAYKNMFIYYGKDTSMRKIVLADPLIADPDNSLIVPISEQFTIDTKLFQRDNIVRKLFNLVDGLVPSRRKVLYVARKQGEHEIKVQGLAGKAVAEANYHHGESSLEQTIIRMAQAYPMARNLPLLLPLGNFGSRSKGYKDSASSRYIYTKINNNLVDKMFRKEDEHVLTYDLDDGNRYEPKYYVPIIPYVLCEDNQLPATGWAIDIHARDIKDIFKNIYAMIADPNKKCGKLAPWCKDFKGSIKTYNNRTYYVGSYEYNETDNTIKITELPPGSYSNAYLRGADDDKISKKKDEKKGIQTKEWVADYDDYTNENSVDITIYLKPGAYEAITADDSPYGNEVIDPLEAYFELTEPIHHHINLINENHEVIEYSNYENVFNDWFIFRKNLYKDRVEREIILIKLEIKMLENQQKFNKNHHEYSITTKTTEEEVCKILINNKYDVFNHSMINNPKFTEVRKLIAMTTRSEHGANYNYILNMSYRDLTENAFEKRNALIAKLIERLKYLEDDKGAFVGAKIWIQELGELEKAIADGIKSSWFYGENIVNFEE